MACSPAHHNSWVWIKGEWWQGEIERERERVGGEYVIQEYMYVLTCVAWASHTHILCIILYQDNITSRKLKNIFFFFCCLPTIIKSFGQDGSWKKKNMRHDFSNRGPINCLVLFVASSSRRRFVGACVREWVWVFTYLCKYVCTHTPTRT